MARDRLASVGVLFEAAWRCNLRVTFRQLVWVEYGGLNVGCFDEARCWAAVPDPVRDDLERSLSGRNAWPQSLLDLVQKLVVIASIAFLAWHLIRRRDMDGEQVAALRNCVILTGVAMVAVAASEAGSWNRNTATSRE